MGHVRPVYRKQELLIVSFDPGCCSANCGSRSSNTSFFSGPIKWGRVPKVSPSGKVPCWSTATPWCGDSLSIAEYLPSGKMRYGRPKVPPAVGAERGCRDCTQDSMNCAIRAP